jgi:NAD(P)-dependent dehydrogenase (short-subunit alcohol dehydrogenase family)
MDIEKLLSFLIVTGRNTIGVKMLLKKKRNSQLKLFMSKIALITGANKGIGYEISRQLGLKGFTVLLGARDKSKGEVAIARLKKEGVEAILVSLDVSKEESVREAKEWVETKYGKLDVLINNAGIVSQKGLTETSTEEVKKVMETNFYGPMRMSIIFLPLLKKAKNAKIINMSSGMGALDDLSGGYAAYRLSKAGLNAQTILLSNELTDTGIKVFAMCPGWVKTDMGGASAPRSVEQGADTAVWLATTEEGESGMFYRDRKSINY